MGLFHLLKEEYEKLFTQRGYDEKSLNSPYKQGQLFLQFSRDLSRAIHLNEDDSSVSFREQTLGIFNDDQDFVLFTFYFLFDPLKSSLAITQLDIFCDGNKRVLMLKNSYELPYAKDGLSLLRHEDRRWQSIDERMRDKRGRKI